MSNKNVVAFSASKLDTNRVSILFGHINKTGGTSYESGLSQALSSLPQTKVHRPNEVDNLLRNPDALRAPNFIFGHGVYEFRKKILDAMPEDQEFAFVTLLRDPFARFESLYNYNNIRNARRQKVDKFFATYKKNPYTQFFGDGDLEAAMSFVRDHCFFVGTAEQFDYSFYVMFRALDFAPTQFTNRVRVRSADRIELSEAARKKFNAENADDLRLYEYVADLLEQRKTIVPEPSSYPFEFVDSEASYVKQTTTNLNLAANNDPVSLLLSGKELAKQGETQKALAFFEKAKDVDRSKFADYVAFVATFDREKAIKIATQELHDLMKGESLGDTTRIEKILSDLTSQEV